MLPELPGELPDWPGALPELPGALPEWPGALPELPGVLPELPGVLPNRSSEALAPCSVPADEPTDALPADPCLTLVNETEEAALGFNATADEAG